MRGEKNWVENYFLKKRIKMVKIFYDIFVFILCIYIYINNRKYKVEK